MLNWIVRNRTDYLYKDWFGIKKPTKVDMPQNSTNQPTNNKWVFWHDVMDTSRFIEWLIDWF